MNEPPRSATRSFIASVLIVIGLLWMALTGLCTAMVTISSLLSDPAGLFGAIPTMLIIAVICIGPGWLIWMGGRSLRARRGNLNP